jgi:hypothetical protein
MQREKEQEGKIKYVANISPRFVRPLMMKCRLQLIEQKDQAGGKAGQKGKGGFEQEAEDRPRQFCCPKT